MNYRWIVVAGAALFAQASLAGAASERCDKPSKEGVRRCENIIKDQPGASSPIKTISYYDRLGDVVDWEINFPTKPDTLPAVALLELSMKRLSPTSDQDTRSKLFRDLVANAVGGETKSFVVGNYDWVSAKTGDSIMVRATARTRRDPKNNGVSIGMTSDQIRRSAWGKPRLVNETLTAAGKHEQWVYGGGYLYLDNGILTSIQTTRR